MDIIILNGKHMRTEEETHLYLARRLQLPAWYGNNLDALADCLSEMGKSRCIILINPEELRASLGDYANGLIEVFSDCAKAPNAFCFILSED